MNITARVFKIENPTGAKVGSASITIQHNKGGLVQTGYSILSGSNGLFVANPTRKATQREIEQKKDKNGYVDTSFSLTKELHKEISDIILKEFNGKDSEQNRQWSGSLNQNQEQDNQEQATDLGDLPF